MNTKSKLLAAVTAGIMAVTSLLGFFPNVFPDIGTGMEVNAEEKAELGSSGKCSRNVRWELDEEGTLTISGYGKMYDYYYNSPFYNNSNITKIIISDGVTSIGKAFSGCTSLENIEIPNSVTDIGIYSFAGCTSKHRNT